MTAVEATNARALVLFPGALGDFLCALPTFCALLDTHPSGIRLIANPQWLPLLGAAGVDRISIDRREIAELYSTAEPLADAARELLGGFGVAYSWTGYGIPAVFDRLSELTRGAVHMFPFRGMAPGEHAVDYYARCVGLKAKEPGPEVFSLATAKMNEFVRAQGLAGRNWLLLHPGSGSTEKNWEGFAELATHWRRQRGEPVVALIGPAEIERDSPRPSADFTVEAASLPEVGALLAAAPYFVGNDTGVSHLAGLLRTRGAVLFGPSDPRTWAPRSPHLEILHRPLPCGTCGPSRFCTHRLGVAEVVAALHRVRPR